MIPILNEYYEVESCLYKLFYGEKYVIVKGKTLSGSIYLINRGYAAFLAAGGGRGNHSGGTGQFEWDGTNALYFRFYTHVYGNPYLQFKIELILESYNAYNLLKREQMELIMAFKDKNCLNNNVNAYIPKFRKSTHKFGWINKGSVLNFKKFLKNS